jgi:DNA-directed RNA polymerase specialized sigma24 family protein
MGPWFNLVGALVGAGGTGAILWVLRLFVRTLCDNWRERRRCKSYLLEEEARRKTRVAEIEAAGKVEVARIRETGKVLRSLAKLEPEQTERLHGHLERVRPPPDELQPPAAS